jgi:hypothetical protein
MSRRRKLLLWILPGAVLAAPVLLLLLRGTHPRLLTSVVGAVLAQDADPRKQAPIPNVEITASDGAVARARSDASGYFRLILRREIWPGATVNLHFRHPDYLPLDMAGRFAGKICLARMVPRAGGQRAQAAAPEVRLSAVRVRYEMSNLTTVNVGSMVRAFEVVNSGDVPCERRRPCSPDGKWKASARSESFDAGEGHEFRNPRVTCIAGPCPFTKIEPITFSRGGRVIRVSALDWSDTATFLFEAEVIQSMPNDAVRQLYPAIFGRNMNFTLPATAQGPSIEAELNGAPIVFPLGPDLILSWASCNMQVAADRTKQYSCELKPGYRFF